jgi:hypothetical protein
MNAAPSNSLPLAGLNCPKCGYDLGGLRERVCPECGGAFDPAAIRRRHRRARRRRWLISMAIMTIVLYAPYSWLLLIEYPWNEYRWFWIRMWPGLPLLLPGSLLSRRLFDVDVDEGIGLVVLIAMGVSLMLGLSWLGTRGRRILTITAVIVLTLSSLNAWCVYQVFRA